MIDDEGIALAKQHGTYLDMDIYDEECIQAEGETGKSLRIFWRTMRTGQDPAREFSQGGKSGREDGLWY